MQPIRGDELRALRRLAREQEPKSPFVFTSERGAPFTTAGFARMVERAGAEAKLGFKAHPHMLRHACGFALANKGHDTRALQAYLGHKNIQHTVRYPELASGRFKEVLAVIRERTLRLAQCKVPSSSSSVIACARHCSLSCWRSQSISSRIRWQTSLASRRRSTSRALGCLLNNTTDPRSLLDPDIAQLGGGSQP
jgi:hypothetical protein